MKQARHVIKVGGFIILIWFLFVLNLSSNAADLVCFFSDSSALTIKDRLALVVSNHYSKWFFFRIHLSPVTAIPFILGMSTQTPSLGIITTSRLNIAIILIQIYPFFSVLSHQRLKRHVVIYNGTIFPCIRKYYSLW